MPRIIRSVVDFPQTRTPARVNTSPRRMVKETLSTATMRSRASRLPRWKTLVRLRVSRMGCMLYCSPFCVQPAGHAVFSDEGRLRHLLPADGHGLGAAGMESAACGQMRQGRRLPGRAHPLARVAELRQRVDQKLGVGM